MIGSVLPTRRSVRVAALVALAVGGTTLALAPAAYANLPSTTTVSASPSSGTVGTSVTLTAKVTTQPLGGLIVTPSGTVTFTYTNVNGNGTLGSATLNSCFLSACTASLSTTALPAGTSTVTAQYNGDGLTAPSSGTTTVTLVVPQPPPPVPTGNSSTVTCNAGNFCEAAVKSSTNNPSNTMDVLSTPSSTQQTVSALLENGKNLHCPQNTDNQTGALGTFSVTVNDTSKTVTYVGFGNTARSMKNNYLAHPTYAGCFGSVNQFNGFVGGVYGPAVFVQSDQLYEAQPGVCSLYAPPCITVSFDANSTTYTLTTPFGDPPKIIG